ncbi:MAG: 1-phosphofructokinase [Lachnospiraceae bacterium]|nr:1-phosphofructokinase [Lachnospiraceae bacterium]
MIYTVTFNPALDYIVTMDELNIGYVNRTNTEQILPGGKGINVSIVLNNLGIENTALGFVAGFTGREIEDRVRACGCITDFVHISEGMSRINIKIKAGKETEINGSGPLITREKLDKLYEKLSALKSGDVLVLAGSIPKTLPDSIYSDIMERLAAKGIKFVVDATGDLLLNVLKYKPFLIKPNNHELAEMFHVNIETKDDIIKHAKKLYQDGAMNVLISMGGAGAILIDENGQVHECIAPDGQVINTVGSGDSMVAGFMAGYIEKKDYVHALKMGIAAGSASAFSRYLATKDEVIEVYRRV